MPGLGPGDRRCKSCRADHFKLLPWSNTSGIRLLSGTMQVRILPAAPLPGGVKVARRPVKPFGVGASPTLAANFGRQADISWLHLSRKQDPLDAEAGAIPAPSAKINHQPIQTHDH